MAIARIGRLISTTMLSRICKNRTNRLVRRFVLCLAAGGRWTGGRLTGGRCCCVGDGGNGLVCMIGAGFGTGAGAGGGELGAIAPNWPFTTVAAGSGIHGIGGASAHGSTAGLSSGFGSSSRGGPKSYWL